MEKVLKIENLSISFDVYGGSVHAVRGVSLDINQGEILALVGESGCGKSVTASSILGLNADAHIDTGAIELCGKNMLTVSKNELIASRGSLAAMVFQDSLTSLNPTMRVGKQITETLVRRRKMTAKEAEAESIRLLELVHIPDAQMRAKQYPHQFSGGMRQRAMIAMALSLQPRLLIADEPTTALDVTIQLEILRLLLQIRKDTGLSILLITHDLSVVANVADRIAVMYAGEIVESGTVEDVFTKPLHPYTIGLFNSLATENGKLHSIPGTPPDLFAPPKGCGFAPRCSECMNICLEEAPPKYEPTAGRTCQCWLLHKEKGADV